MSKDPNKTHVAGLAIQVPDEMLKNIILAEVAKAIPNPERWVEAVVRDAMSEKERTYGKETKFEAAIKGEIRTVAKGVFKEWLGGQKERIRDQLVSELNKRSQKRVKEIAAILSDSMANVCVRSIHLSVRDDIDG